MQVAGLDIGYGNVKLTAGRNAVDKKIVCHAFPAIAPLASNGDLSGGVMGRRNTITVEVDGTRFEVGPDAHLLQRAAARERTLRPDYSQTPQYLALVRGALHYAGKTRLDFVVVGLPVSTYSQHRDALRKLTVGKHQVGERTIEVCDARVVPQPLGGFFDHSVQTQRVAQMTKQTNLLIDVGFYTLDWLATEGVKAIDSRSGAANDGGMASVLASVARAFAAEHGCTVEELGAPDRLDAALRGESIYRFAGNEVTDLRPYQGEAQARARQAISELRQNVGTLNDIDNIVLCGGGAAFYAPLLKAELNRNVEIVVDPVFANVRGFHLLAEREARAKAERRAA